MARRGRSKPGSSTNLFPSQARHRYCASSVLRAAGKQANAMTVTCPICQPSFIPADRLSLYLPRVWGPSAGPSRKVRMFRRVIQDQAAYCAGADPRALRRALLPGLVLMDAVTATTASCARPHGIGSQLRRSHHPTRQSTHVARDDPSRRASSSKHGRSACQARLRTRHVRGLHQLEAAIALCPCARLRAAPIRGEARFSEERFLIEMAQGEANPTTYWLTTFDPNSRSAVPLDLANCAGVSARFTASQAEIAWGGGGGREKVGEKEEKDTTTKEVGKKKRGGKEKKKGEKRKKDRERKKKKRKKRKRKKKKKKEKEEREREKKRVDIMRAASGRVFPITRHASSQPTVS